MRPGHVLWGIGVSELGEEDTFAHTPTEETSNDCMARVSPKFRFPMNGRDEVREEYIDTYPISNASNCLSSEGLLEIES